MAKPKTEGFPYCQQDTDTFQDVKIRTLIAKFGCDGYAVWDYIKQAAYKEHGYYVEWNEERQDLTAADLYISAEKTGLIVAYLLKRSLLTSKSFNGITVLTSHGIQKRFQEMAKSAKRDYYIYNPEVWLLSEEETLRFIFCTLKNDNSGIKAYNSGIKHDNSGINAQKKRKEKNKYVPRAYDAAREKFFEEFPQLRTDGTDNFSGIDFEKMSEKFRQSKKWLQTSYSWKWVLSNYKDIIAGKFDDHPESENSGKPAEQLSEAVKAANARADREQWYFRRREEAERKAELAQEQARRFPAFCEAEKALKRLEIDHAKAELYEPEKVPEIEAEQETWRKKKASALLSAGLKESDLFPKWHCKKCEDTGFLSNGAMCDCYGGGQ